MQQPIQAQQGPGVLRDLQVPRVFKDLLVYKGLQVPMARQPIQVLQDLRDPQGSKDLRAWMVRLPIQALQEALALLGPRVYEVPRVLMAKQPTQAQQDPEVLQDLQGLLAWMGALPIRVPQEFKGLQALQVPRV